MNDLIENSQDEVICLLLSFFDKLQMEPECCNLLDGISEGLVSRLRGFLQEAICSWISMINDVVAHENSSSIEIDMAKLALLWGIVRCYPHIMDVQANSSLLMELIDALHRLSLDEAGKTSSITINLSVTLCELMNFNYDSDLYYTCLTGVILC